MRRGLNLFPQGNGHPGGGGKSLVRFSKGEVNPVESSRRKGELEVMGGGGRKKGGKGEGWGRGREEEGKRRG